MADVSLRHIQKIYPHTDRKVHHKKKTESGKPAETTHEYTDEGVIAVKDFNLEIKDKEFIVFVGPSGCGKSTTDSFSPGKDIPFTFTGDVIHIFSKATENNLEF